MSQIKLSELIDHLQSELKQHGDVPIYYSDDAWIAEQTYMPSVVKIYSYKSYNFLNHEDLSVRDEDLYDVDLNKPIVKGMIL